MLAKVSELPLPFPHSSSIHLNPTELLITLGALETYIPVLARIRYQTSSFVWGYRPSKERRRRRDDELDERSKRWNRESFAKPTIMPSSSSSSHRAQEIPGSRISPFRKMKDSRGSPEDPRSPPSLSLRLVDKGDANSGSQLIEGRRASD